MTAVCRGAYGKDARAAAAFFMLLAIWRRLFRSVGFGGRLFRAGVFLPRLAFSSLPAPAAFSVPAFFSRTLLFCKFEKIFAKSDRTAAFLSALFALVDNFPPSYYNGQPKDHPEGRRLSPSKKDHPEGRRISPPKKRIWIFYLPLSMC
ncbi:MAG TPA: hypothetical protein H9851_05620 [Candidatus Borkfalkia faecavium]|uniref:Transmembrane protein n=1 Tax=Candidatus Borkfalkia faecavium TaxID=2838508 RepID=A0A9D1W1V6_9FIRM|nr:hypothetical protein [Candidatus Borkfalkia faecavium]